MATHGSPSQSHHHHHHHAVLATSPLASQFPSRYPKPLSPREEEDNYSPTTNQHLFVLPVLLLEFLALALTRAVLPGLLLQQYGDKVYLVMGCVDCVRGLLAFMACPLFGKLSDIIGRRICLFVTVLGTCAPVCCLAFFPWNTGTVTTITTTDKHDDGGGGGGDGGGGFWSLIVDTTTAGTANTNQTTIHPGVVTDPGSLHPYAMTVFIILLALSGIVSSTFTLVFAYISDTVRRQEDRISAFGLALATFGLSFTIGPMLGGYMAKTDTQYVFLTSLALTILDLLYIHFILPESRPSARNGTQLTSTPTPLLLEQYSWNPWDAIRLVLSDPFLSQVGQVAFLYYTGLWAIISTLSVYAVKRFHLSPERLGELMSALGLCTMLAEAVLVRIMVPILGEKQSIKVGLISFTLQCVVLGLANRGWHLFICVLFSLLGNLVYPSLSSLVSGNVEPNAIGEALGAMNGIKALTEGIGPLVFGTLMTLSEHSAIPGWPYLLAAVLVATAYQAVDRIPDGEDYVHELDRRVMAARKHATGAATTTPRNKYTKDDGDNEYDSLLLSEIDDSSEEEGLTMITRR